MRFLKRYPAAGTTISLNELSGMLPLFWKRQPGDFERQIAQSFQVQRAFTVSNGTAAFYLLLKALYRISGKKQVIIPAYTAPALFLPIKVLGLEVVLCEVSLDTLSLDLDFLSRVIGPNTLCVVPVYLFGLASDIKPVLELASANGAYVIEDCAQSWGTLLDGKPAGSFGNAAFTSFGRGKNFNTYAGGAILSNLGEISSAVLEEIQNTGKPSFMDQIGLAARLAAVSMAVRPWFYGMFYFLIKRFKSVIVPPDFALKKFSRWQAAVGSRVIEKQEKDSRARYENGMALIEELKECSGIILPEIIPGSRPAFNRLPVLVKYPGLRDDLAKMLFRKGIETSRMYERPMHWIYDLGYSMTDENNPFVKATYLSQRLVTLPVHPLMGLKAVRKIAFEIKKYFSRHRGEE